MSRGDQFIRMDTAGKTSLEVQEDIIKQLEARYNTGPIISEARELAMISEI